MSNVPPEVELLAKKCAEHRVVPFLGAGCSQQQLGLDWDGLGLEMARALGAEYIGDNIAIASEFVARFGRNDLAKLLWKRLHAERFDPKLGAPHLAVLGLNLGTLYSTSQDNLTELCHATYGRPLSVVIGIEDIAKLVPGDPVLYKFHGDLSAPDSIVFTAEDYAARGPLSANPLDIRLRSDALGKSLLFLGYSFRDPNVRALFAHLRDLFGGYMPTSHLVQYGSDAEFAEMLAVKFGIEAIDCTHLYPDASTPDDALDRFFGDLCTETVRHKAGQQIQDLFRSRIPPSRQVVLAMTSPRFLRSFLHAQ